MLKAKAVGAMLLLMLCTTLAAAQEATKNIFVVPEQKILGAEKAIALGKLVRLRVSPIAKTPDYLVSSSYHWKVYDYDTSTGDLVELDDVVDLNGSIFFGAGVEAKKLKAICVCTHLYLVKDDKGVVKEAGTRTVMLTANVHIGKSDPSPGPDPLPAPDLPDGTYKLAKAAYQTAFSKVKSTTARTKGAAALAKSYRGIVGAIQAGTIPTMKEALTQSKTVNNQGLKDAGVEVSAWDDFGTAMEDIVYELYNAKKINNVTDLGAAWLEVARGLEKVK